MIGILIFIEPGLQNTDENLLFIRSVNELNSFLTLELNQNDQHRKPNIIFYVT